MNVVSKHFGRWLGAVGVVLMAFATTTSAAWAQVVVLPFEPRGVAIEVTELATDELLGALEGIERLRVIDPKTVEDQLNVDLTEQARACEYDVFCLVEIARFCRPRPSCWAMCSTSSASPRRMSSRWSCSMSRALPSPTF